MCDVPTLCRGDIVWKLAPGAADWSSRSVLPHTRATQLDTKCTVLHTLWLFSTVRGVKWWMNSSWLSIFFKFFFFCRGIFKLLVKFQLENKDNPSYTGTHVLETTKCGFPLQHDYFALLLFFFVFFNHCTQDYHSKISTNVVGRHSWWTQTSHWGHSWLSSETTNWFAHARLSPVSH